MYVCVLKSLGKNGNINEAQWFTVFISITYMSFSKATKLHLLVALALALALAFEGEKLCTTKEGTAKFLGKRLCAGPGPSSK